jgi:thiol-disulfide isomerase/thioredoxin
MIKPTLTLLSAAITLAAAVHTVADPQPPQATTTSPLTASTPTAPTQSPAAPAASSATSSSPLTPTADAKVFLLACMDRYRAFKTFQASVDVAMSYGFGPPMSSARTMAYATPNRFKVVSSNGFFKQTSVSDGKQVLEYSNMPGLGAERYPAPDAIADVGTMQMMHPMFCGTLLYQFFGGADNIDQLARTDTEPIHYGPDAVVNGLNCKAVRFYGVDTYGHVSIAIAVSNGLVQRISYDSEPLLAMMRQGTTKAAIKEAMAKLKKQGHTVPTLNVPTPSQIDTAETYHDFLIDAQIPVKAFALVLPSGLKVTDMPEQSRPKPPVAVGQQVPEFTVVGMDGKSIKLSSLRGHPVLLDFWATWCPPCRASLPETQNLYHSWSGHGLDVMTIDDEKASVIRKFIRANRYTFPAFRDASKSAGKAFHVNAIPTLVVIDGNGKLVSYMVGLQDPGAVQSAVEKAMGTPGP